MRVIALEEHYSSAAVTAACRKYAPEGNPAGPEDETPANAGTFLASADLAPEVRERIAHLNAERLLKL